MQKQMDSERDLGKFVMKLRTAWWFGSCNEIISLDGLIFHFIDCAFKGHRLAETTNEWFQLSHTLGVLRRARCGGQGFWWSLRQAGKKYPFTWGLTNRNSCRVGRLILHGLKIFCEYHLRSSVTFNDSLKTQPLQCSKNCWDFWRREIRESIYHFPWKWVSSILFNTFYSWGYQYLTEKRIRY